MSELLLHFSVPFVLAKMKFGLKETMIIALAALLPDIDALLYVHRSMTHSLVVITLIFIPVLLTVYKTRPNYITLVFACYLAIASHILMDVFQTYTPLLYPIVGDSIMMKAEGSIVISSTMRPKVTTTVQMRPTNFMTFKELDAPVYTSEGLVISSMLVVGSILLSSKIRRGR